MQNHFELTNTLRQIDDKGYKAYKAIKASYTFEQFVLHVDYVQGDPFAEPSRVCAEIVLDKTIIPAWCYENAIRRVATADFFHRRMFSFSSDWTPITGASGKSGVIAIEPPCQEVLARTAMVIEDNMMISCRFGVGLPGRGRSVMGQAAIELLCQRLPALIAHTFFDEHFAEDVLRHHVAVVEDQTYIRANLASVGLTAFVGDGAILPRQSGVCPEPMATGIPFHSPPSMACTFHCPNQGDISGMGIPEGITLIVGGGYHGKSTLLNALELGIYNHCPGDGREFVVTRNDAVKIRAEDRRHVCQVNISGFIQALPQNKNTERFTTQDASGSTSQATNIIEAMELGSRLLLLDEDTSATNFMIRDRRMQALIQREPIIPLIDRVECLHRQFGMSTMMVIGGAGDYLDVADKVIMMENFQAYDVSDRAREVAKQWPSTRVHPKEATMPPLVERHPSDKSIDPSKGKYDVRIQIYRLTEICFGNETIDIGALSQLTDVAQTRSIAHGLVYVKSLLSTNTNSFSALAQTLDHVLKTEGLSTLAPHREGQLAEVRGMDTLMALNRLRTLLVE